MCSILYLSSQKQLQTVKWDKEDPGFHIDSLSDEDQLNMIRPFLKGNYFYEIGSHMGCSCGLSYGKWSMHDEDENHSLRVKDVSDLKAYLLDNLNDNQLFLFNTLWEDVRTQYHTKEFDLNKISELEFEIEEDVILRIGHLNKK